MGIDVSHWCDHNLDLSSLSELMYTLERGLNKRMYLAHRTYEKDAVYYTNTINGLERIKQREYSFRIVITKPNNSVQVGEEVKGLSYFLSDFDCELELEDRENLIKDISCDFSQLIDNENISLTLIYKKRRFFHVSIYKKTIHIMASEIEFCERMPTLVKVLLDKEQGFTKYHLETLYLLGQFTRCFQSTKLLLVGDSGNSLWEGIGDDLVRGISIDEAIETREEKIILITSKMLISKNLPTITDKKERDKIVFLLLFKDLHHIHIHCSLTERFLEKDFVSRYSHQYIELKRIEKGSVKDDGEIETFTKVILQPDCDQWAFQCYEYNLEKGESDRILTTYFTHKHTKKFLKDIFAIDFSKLFLEYLADKEYDYIYSFKYKVWDGSSFNISIKQCPDPTSEVKKALEIFKYIFDIADGKITIEREIPQYDPSGSGLDDATIDSLPEYPD